MTEVEIPASQTVSRDWPLSRGSYRLMFHRSDDAMAGPKATIHCTLSLKYPQSPDVAARQTTFRFGGPKSRTHLETLVVEQGSAVLSVAASSAGLPPLPVLRDSVLKFQLRVCQISADSSIPSITLANADPTDTLLLFINKENMSHPREYSLVCQPGRYFFAIRNSGELGNTSASPLQATITLTSLGAPSQTMPTPKLFPDTETWSQEFHFQDATTFSVMIESLKPKPLESIFVCFN